MAAEESYPAQLPLPRKTGYEIRPGEAVARTEMERGAARQRRISLSAADTLPVQFLFTSYEKALFDGWYKHKADEGGAFFTMTVLDGLGLIEVEARFVRVRRAVPSGRLWRIDAEIEVRDRPVLSEGATELALGNDLEGLLAAIAAADDAVNRHLAVNAPW